MKKFAVVLAGSGMLDGSEIQESVLTLLAIAKSGACYQCFAPSMQQRQVVNHLTEQVVEETRDVLVESARIARGDIEDIARAKVDDFDGVFFPGGYGVVQNLCDFAVNGIDCQVHPDVERFAKLMLASDKPLGFICIAPVMIPRICGENMHCTIGDDETVAQQLQAMGAHHINCDVDDIIIDRTHKVVSTPAYMLGTNIADVAEGISKLVSQVVAFAE